MSQSTTPRSCLERAAEQVPQVLLPDSAAPIEVHVFQAALLPVPSAVAGMRGSTAAFLARIGLRGALADNVVLVVSEFITNAIEHGHGSIELALCAVGGTITVSVTDENPAPAVLKQAGPDDTSGRGMALVAALADRWGSSGEETWCEFRCGSTRSAA